MRSKLAASSPLTSASEDEAEADISFDSMTPGKVTAHGEKVVYGRGKTVKNKNGRRGGKGRAAAEKDEEGESEEAEEDEEQSPKKRGMPPKAKVPVQATPKEVTPKRGRGRASVKGKAAADVEDAEDPPSRTRKRPPTSNPPSSSRPAKAAKPSPAPSSSSAAAALSSSKKRTRTSTASTSRPAPARETSTLLAELLDSSKAREPPPRRSVKAEEWKLSKFSNGVVAWVRLDAMGQPVEKGGKFWWPVDVIDNGIDGVEVSFQYGKPDPAPSQYQFFVPNPSPANLQPFRIPPTNVLRFYSPISPPSLHTASPTSAQRTQPEPFHVSPPNALHKALLSALECAQEDDDDSLPDADPEAWIFAAASGTGLGGEESDGEAKSLVPTSPDAMDEDEASAPDPSIDMPESVFAEWQRCYWPARVIDFLPADASTTLKNRKKKDLYLVQFEDGTEKKLPRDKFFTSLEKEGFTTCTLGKTVVEKKKKDVDADADDYVPPEWGTFSAEQFNELPIGRQVRYCLSRMREVMNGEYGPAQKRHADFIAGGSRRGKLTKQPMFGRYSHKLDAVTDELMRFAQPQDPALQPQGDAGYGELSGELVNSYVTAVLLPEMLLQLLMQSEDLRASHATEDDAYAAAEQCLADDAAENWVPALMAHREMLLRQAGGKEKDGGDEDDDVVYSNTGRVVRKTAGAAKKGR